MPGPSVEIALPGDKSGDELMRRESAGKVIAWTSGGRVIPASRLYSGLEERHQFKSSKNYNQKDD